MTIREVNYQGNMIRRPSWEEGQYLLVVNTQGYAGTDFGFEARHYGPEGFLRNKNHSGQRIWWIPGSHEATDWEIVK